MARRKRVVGITRVKDEADVIESVVRHMLKQVDMVIVNDNGSTDGTVELLEKVQLDLPEPGTTMQQLPWPRLVVRGDNREGYYQSKYMTEIAAHAHEVYGADWIVPFDADELWLPRDPGWGTIADVLNSLPEHEAVATAHLWNRVATGVDPAGNNPITTMEWRRKDRLGLPKVAALAVAPVRIAMGNHDADYGTRTPSPVFTVHHFPYRSVEQMIRKTRNGAKAYRAAPDLDETFGQHWRDHDRMTDEQIGEAFRRYYWVADPNHDLDLVHNPLTRYVT